MHKKLYIFLFLITHILAAQKAELASSYFKNGDYEKAIILYKPLHEKNPIRRDYFKNLLISYQQLEQYEWAELLITYQLNRFPNQIYLNIELGYNFQLQGNMNKAHEYYEICINHIDENPNYTYAIGRTFKENHLLDYALKSYQIAKAKNPKLNTEISEAQIYGEQGELEKMFESYLNLIEKNEKYYPSIQRYIATFITNDRNNETNILFKKLLLKRAQNNPNDSWNILLSWLYMQQKEYNKAFLQEKSLYKRNPDNLDRIVEVGVISFENMDLEIAKDIFNFILKTNEDSVIILQTQIYLLQIDNKLATTMEEFAEIDKKYQFLFERYGKNNATLNLQLSYADFLSFTYNQPEKAIQILKEVLPMANSKFQKGAIQLKLADVLVYTNQFNQALILYSQIQNELKNSTLAQTARFKVAQTSYFKGDFYWAQTQLKVLKSSTSQLIANDALDLYLLITNNIENDSIHDALKGYAKSDLLAFQNKNMEAIDTLASVLIRFKGHPIEDEALFKQAELFIKTKKYAQAESNYLKIIEINQDGILMDDAYYYLAKLYTNQLNNPVKAKEMYQKIVFEFTSSIYLVEARKNYRKLRGDEIQ